MRPASAERPRCGSDWVRMVLGMEKLFRSGSEDNGGFFMVGLPGLRRYDATSRIIESMGQVLQRGASAGIQAIVLQWESFARELDK